MFMKMQYVRKELGACDSALQKVKSLQIGKLLRNKLMGVVEKKKKGEFFLGDIEDYITENKTAKILTFIKSTH
jgi:hypothetical protein